MKNKFFITLILITYSVVSFTCCRVYGEARGTSVFSFLKIDPSARTSGMGGIISVPGSQSVLTNQAALPHLRNKEISFQHLSYISGSSYNMMTYTSPINEKSAWSCSAGILGVNNIVRTEYDADSANGYVKKGEFDFSDSLLNFSYGKKTSGSFSYGASFKLARESVDNKSIFGAMASFSGLYFNRAENEIFSFGLFNMGPGVKGYNLPAGGYVGLGSCFGNNHFLIGELVVYGDGVKVLRAGFEYNILKIASLRSGYRYQLAYGPLGDSLLNGVSWGIGINFGSISFDYAWNPFDLFGNMHRMGFTFKI